MSQAALRVTVVGAAGRMGRTVMQVLSEDTSSELVGALDAPGCPGQGKVIGVLAGVETSSVVLSDDIHATTKRAQVVIDFSSPGSTAKLLDVCLGLKLPAVIGTTGLDTEGKTRLGRLAAVAPVVHAPNFSQGVTVMFYLAELASRLLGESYDAEIVEMHHRHKVDAPSGTALRLAEGVAKARRLGSKAFTFGRDGQVGARPSDQIGVLALRGGGVVGDHTLILADPSERLELVHRAQDRGVFARGAVRAAHWVVTQPAGLYDMFDVLGIERS